MKINELIVESKHTTYSKTLAYQLPLGIRSVKQLCDESIKIAVNDVGIVKAGTIFTDKFILEMLTTYNNRCLQEGIGSFLGKTAGHVVGAVGAAGRGLKGAWNDAKQGYRDAKASWDPKNSSMATRLPGGTTQAAPQAGGVAASAGIPAPTGGGTTQAAPQAGGTAPAAPKPTTPTASAPATGKQADLGFGFNSDTGVPFKSAQEIADAGEHGEAAAAALAAKSAGTPLTAPTLTPAQIRQQKQTAAAATAQGQMAANPAPSKPTAPAPAVWKNNRDPSAPATTSPFATSKTQGQSSPGSTPGTPEYEATQAQIIANSNDEKLQFLATQGKAPGIREKAAAEIARRQQQSQAPAPAAAAPTANYGQQVTGYGKQTMNAPAGIPAVKQPAKAAPAVPPEDEEDNPNIQRGSNESKVFSKFLGRMI